MTCPLCSKEFTVPDDGLSGLQKNYEIDKLLHVRRLSAGQEAQQMNMCEQHKDKQIEAFCQDCEVVVCVKCVITSHKSNDWVDIEKVSEDLRKLVLSDNHKISEAWKKTDELR